MLFLLKGGSVVVDSFVAASIVWKLVFYLNFIVWLYYVAYVLVNILSCEEMIAFAVVNAFVVLLCRD